MTNRTIGDTAQPDGIEQARNYRAVLEEAIELSKQIKFIRTPDDKEIYQRTIETLFLASTLNPAEDWPLVKICAIEKLWSTDFNQRILDAATEALRRRQTLEAFIYCCRSHIRIKESDAAAYEAISEVMSSIRDAEVANVGNLFKAMVKYEQGDYAAYTHFIEVFRNTKSADFNPYIAIPASTVYTEASFAPADFEWTQTAICGKPVSIAKFDAQDCKYIISISCDEKYFDMYGKYIVKSFAKNCSHEAVLHITFLDGEPAGYRSAIAALGGKNVEFVISDIATEANKGPIASLLRFMNVSALLETYSLPVLVLDLDTVIRKPFADMVSMMLLERVDLLSRLLESGMAPWEKYTGGFAFFSNSANAKVLARNIAYIGTEICRTDVSQWWIDQNILEAGIRENLLRGGGLCIKNIYAIRDQYCAMPVGSPESKTYMLESALSAHS